MGDPQDDQRLTDAGHGCDLPDVIRGKRANRRNASPVVPSFASRADHFISSAEMVSPPLRVIILLRTNLLIWLVTGRTPPSQKAKFTMLG